MAYEPGYSIRDYGGMISDDARMSAYRESLEKTISPGCTVCDIGCGTGIFSLLACQLGASKVYAIEPNRSIFLAKQIASQNGYADRIIFIHDMSTQVQLPEKVDVIVADLRGALPWNEGHLEAILDARKRLLSPSGILINQGDTVMAAVVDASDVFQKLQIPWLTNKFGLNLKSGWVNIVNDMIKIQVKPEQLLTEPYAWTAINYATFDKTSVDQSFTLTVSRSAPAHGILVWFDAELAGKVHFSNAPGLPDMVYGTTFFPWEESVNLDVDDQVFVRLAAKLIGKDYLWRWECTVISPDSASIFL